MSTPSTSSDDHENDQQQQEQVKERKSFLVIRDSPIYFDEDWDTGIGGGLWSTGLAMAKYFQNYANTVRREFINHDKKNSNDNNNNNNNIRSSIISDDRINSSNMMRVIELGSGNGFLSVCFLALAEDLVEELVVTDLEDHLELMQKTLDANRHLDPQNKVRVCEYKWGQDNQNDDKSNKNNITNKNNNTSNKFDLILGTDVAYHVDLYDIFISSLDRVSHSESRALIGVTMNDTKPLFFEKLRKAGFRYERLADHFMPAEFRGPTFGIFVIMKRRQEQ